MASTSKHHVDVAIWIEKVINSCETPLQETTAKKLVRLFEIQYRDIEQPPLDRYSLGSGSDRFRILDT